MRKDAMEEFRIERDSLGEVRVPAVVLWGAQTQRAVENFPVSGRPVPLEVVHALVRIKRAYAVENRLRGALPPPVADAVEKAATEVLEGRWDDQFPVDVFQTGSGTSTNMNVNEVLANRAIQLLGGAVGSKTPVHPNDHVNLGQSSNDVFPSAVRLAAAQALRDELVPAVERFHAVLERKSEELDGVVKIGRTHLQDAVPIRLGQEFSGYARQAENGLRRLAAALPPLCELALGGTAVGTGLNAPEGLALAVIARLAEETGLPLRQAPNLFEALAAQDGLVEASAAMRSLAVSLMKIAEDIRWLASGPRCGLGEIVLPDLQPGSSIMPGKVNPVMAEMVLMVSVQVMADDYAVAVAGTQGRLELNVMLPLLARSVLEQSHLLSRGLRLFSDRCLEGIRADEARCRELVERSLSLVTALTPVLGYDTAAALAKEAHARGLTIREICREKGLLSEERLSEWLDARRMTGG